MSFLYGMHASGSWVDRRASNMLDGGLPWYQIYETSDGKFLAVGALEPQFYQALLDGLGLSIEEAPQDGQRRAARALRARSSRRAPGTSGWRSSPAPTPASRRCCR